MLAEATARCVLEQYPGIGPIRGVQFLAGAGGFSGSRLWKVERESFPLCLRRWPAEHPAADRLLLIHGLLAHLKASGISGVPVPLVNRIGTTYLTQDGHLWELNPWMPGKADFRENPSRARLAAAMRKVAQIHQALREAGLQPGQKSALGRDGPLLARPSPTLLSRREQVTTLLHGGADQLAAAVERHRDESLASRGLRLLSHFRRLAPHVAPRLEAAANLRVPLFPVIRDLWHDHVLFTGDEVTGVIDFGAMRVDSAACDLARLLGSFVADDTAAWDFALDAYAAVRPLAAEERALIHPLEDANVLLAGLNWLTWICVDGREFENLPAVYHRLDEALGRLERR